MDAHEKKLEAENERLRQEMASLEAWIDQQIDGLHRSSMVGASHGALAAFEKTKDKIGELWR